MLSQHGIGHLDQFHNMIGDRMSTEYGIFNDEGCLEQGIYDEGEAYITKDDSYQDEPGVYVAEVCPEHDLQPREFCEDCETT
jgi:hypothetical protein